MKSLQHPWNISAIDFAEFADVMEAEDIPFESHIRSAK
jgi:hypothetical protein